MLDADFREGNEPGDELTVTYRELLQRVCQFANVLKAQGELLPAHLLAGTAPSQLSMKFKVSFTMDLGLWFYVLRFLNRFINPARFSFLSPGVKKGDRVSIYMPMVVELVVAMLACVRIGAVHSIVVSCRHP